MVVAVLLVVVAVAGPVYLGVREAPEAVSAGQTGVVPGGAVVSGDSGDPVSGSVALSGRAGHGGAGGARQVGGAEAAGTITTIVGTGRRGYNGDGIPATEARIHLPFGMAFDGAGNLYVVERFGDRVRKIDTRGIITTIAGTGKRGYNGDGIPGDRALLDHPRGIAVDPSGNVYISDPFNNRVRRVDRKGIITTYAGTGVKGYNGDGIRATRARLNGPRGLAVDAAGNLYITERFGNRIRKVNARGRITTVAGTGVKGYNGDGIPATRAWLNNPYGVAVDAQGNVYIADRFNHRVRKVDRDGTITTIAGTGVRGFNGDGIPAVQARLSHPYSVAVAADGTVFFSDRFNHRVRAIDKSGTISTVAGNGRRGYNGDGIPATEARLNHPWGVMLDAGGNLYIADAVNHRVRKVGDVPARAAFTAEPPVGRSPLSVRFDGSASQGSIASYGWDFGDGSSGTGPVVSHTYTGAGPFVRSVVLTVSDERGRSSSATSTVALNVPLPSLPAELTCRGAAASIAGSSGPDRIVGDGVVVALAGDDEVVGGGTICLGPGGDTAKGSGGTDVIVGDAGADRLFGRGGDDRLFGDAGGDLLAGGPGDDLLRGGVGLDRLLGQSGDDRLFGDLGKDRLVGGRGSDLGDGGRGRDDCETERKLRC